MAVPRFIFLVTSVLHFLPQSLHSINHSTSPRSDCPTFGIFNLTGEPEDKFGVIEKSGHAFPAESIWFENAETFGCVCDIEICVPLCCPSGMAWTRDDCVEDNQSTTADFVSLNSSVTKYWNHSETNAQKIHFVTSDTCNYTSTTVIQPEEDSQNDTYYLDDYEIDDIILTNDFHSYCLSRDVNSSDYELILCETTQDTYDGPSPLWPSTGGSISTPKTKPKKFGMIVSVPFLLVSFVVYTILPEIKNIHGLTLKGYVGCLLVAYTTSGVVENSRPLRRKFLCHFSGFAIQFSFLASFFWLNVMCFDIWRTFRSLSSPQENIRQLNRRKNRMYSMYAWGCAISFTVVCVIMNYAPVIPKTLTRPEFGLPKHCWFKKTKLSSAIIWNIICLATKGKALYFYGPMGVTVLCNIFFLILTVLKIIRIKKDAAQDLHDDNEKWFNLHPKVFIVMGINWITELISWLCGGSEFLWYVTDLVTAIHSILIFLIFVCKKEVKDFLMERSRFGRATE